MRPILVLACLLARPVVAEPKSSDFVRLEVLPGWRTEEGRHMAALRLTLASGWKTYWRVPGAAGLAPILDFSESTGITTAEPRWPVPDVFYSGSLRSIGYHDTVTIPVDLSLNGLPAQLAGEIEIGVCNEICIPVSLPFAVNLPEDGRRDPFIAAALADRPLTAEEAGAHAVCVLAAGTEGANLTVHLMMPPLGPDEVVVIESNDLNLWISEAAAQRDGATLVATAEALGRDDGPLVLDRSSIRITVLSEGKAVEIWGCQAT